MFNLPEPGLGQAGLFGQAVLGEVAEGPKHAQGLRKSRHTGTSLSHIFSAMQWNKISKWIKAVSV